MIVCFIGHRKILENSQLVLSLDNTLHSLIDEGATTFLFGSMSEFNDLSWKIVTELKVKYPFIKRVYVRSSYQYIDERYEKYLLESYEETYFPPKLEKAGKYSYVERNCEMIDSSTYCVFYYNENYVSSSRLQSKGNSGTKIAYNYANKKKKIIINLYK